MQWNVIGVLIRNDDSNSSYQASDAKHECLAVCLMSVLTLIDNRIDRITFHFYLLGEIFL